MNNAVLVTRDIHNIKFVEHLLSVDAFFFLLLAGDVCLNVCVSDLTSEIFPDYGILHTLYKI